MIVVSNTSPLNYLVLVDAVHVLPVLYGRVLVPPQVVAELQSPDTPWQVRAWLESTPGWLQVQAPAHVDPTLKLHAGEAQAIALAQEFKADRILLDDKDGREAARERGLRAIGTLTVLDEAAARELINLRQALQTLRTGTSFRMSDELEAEHLTREERRAIQRQIPQQRLAHPHPRQEP